MAELWRDFDFAGPFRSHNIAASSCGACVAVSLLVTFCGKAFVGQWSADPWENVRLVGMNLVALLLSAWRRYARLHKRVGVIDKLESAGPQGAPCVVHGRGHVQAG